MSQSPESAAPAPAEAERYRLGWKALSELIGQGRAFSGHEKNTCFLNTRDGRFADISVASGLGVDDDARAVALCDWDFDGRADIWVSNRTAPRVRLLRNASTGGGPSLGLHLTGTTCNRDAIGARVVVQLRGGARRVRSLRAGEGFLAQSSKWLHIGLGADGEVASVVVHWPGGSQESFDGARAGGFFRLVQGRGRAEEFAPPAGVRSPPRVSPYPELPREDAMRTWILGRLPLPDVPEIPRSPASPLLVNLWSQTCRPCLEELAEWNRAEMELRAAGLDILALNVDALIDGEGKAASPPQEFPFRSATATAGTVEVLELLNRSMVELQQPLPAPSSFLLDRTGAVAAIYKGRVSVAQLLADVALLDKPAEVQRDAAVPFPGRWASLVLAPQPLRYAEALAANGRPARRIEYLAKYLRSTPAPDVQLHLGHLLLAENRVPEAIAAFDGLFATAADAPALHREAGVLLLQCNAGDPARRHLEAALPAFANDASFHFNLAIAAISTGFPEQALTHFREAARLDPKDAAAHFQIGNVLQLTGRGRDAIPHYRAALAVRPGWAFPANNLAWLLATDRDDAIRNGTEALALARALAAADTSGNPAVLSTLAAAEAESGDFTAAIGTATRAIELARQSGDTTQARRLEEARTKYLARQPLRSP